MLAILSPAKSLDFESPLATAKASTPAFVDESKTLIRRLRKLAPAEVGSLMKISDKLAELNHRRYAEWRPEFDATEPAFTRPAILAFKGDVYIGFDAGSLGERDFTWAQKHVRILSGLHGLLRPLDLIHPYRLEMGTKLTSGKTKDLYGFWGGKVTDALNQALADQGDEILVNLASNEYYGVLQPERINARIINVQFKEWRDGKLRFMSFFAKKARGSMARYMVDHRVKTLKALRGFDSDGYSYDAELSSGNNWVFTR